MTARTEIFSFLRNLQTNGGTSLVGSQIGAGVVLLVSAAIPFPLVAFYFNYGEKQKLSKVTVGNLSFFASGALLALGIVHILPEAIEELGEVSFTINGNAFNYGWTVTALGVVVIMLLEHATHTLIGSHGMQMHSNATATNSNPPLEATVYGKEFAESSIKDETTVVPIDTSNKEQTTNIDSHLMFTTAVTAIVLFTHALFDGAIVGTRNDVVSIWITTGVICSHKVFVALSLGTSMIASGMQKKHYALFSTVFILSSPIGIILFVLLPENHVAEAIIGCLATSSVIYIAFEMLFGELNKTYTLMQRTIQIGLFVVGIAILVGATLIEVAYGAHSDE